MLRTPTKTFLTPGRLWLLVLYLGAIGPSSDAATVNFWLSSANGNSGPGAPTTQVLAGQTAEVEIWARPASGLNLKAFALNLVAEQLGAITFTNVEVLNPFYIESNPANPIRRHQLVFDSSESVGPAGIELRPDRIVGFSGLTFSNDADNLFPGGGIGPTCEDSFCEYDTGGQPMWKIGTVHFVSGAAGTSTPLFLEISTQGIWHAGENPTDTSATFGHTSDMLHEWAVPMDADPDDHRNMHFGLPDAIIEVVSVLPDADFNGDSDVDGADFLTWQRGFGAETTHNQGDANFDGFIDGQDLSSWESQYGTNGSSPLNAIPEPATVDFLAVLVVCGWIILPIQVTREDSHPIMARATLHDEESDIDRAA